MKPSHTTVTPDSLYQLLAARAELVQMWLEVTLATRRLSAESLRAFAGGAITEDEHRRVTETLDAVVGHLTDAGLSLFL